MTGKEKTSSANYPPPKFQKKSQSLNNFFHKIVREGIHQEKMVIPEARTDQESSGQFSHHHKNKTTTSKQLVCYTMEYLNRYSISLMYSNLSLTANGNLKNKDIERSH